MPQADAAIWPIRPREPSWEPLEPTRRRDAADEYWHRVGSTVFEVSDFFIMPSADQSRWRMLDDATLLFLQHIVRLETRVARLEAQSLARQTAADDDPIVTCASLHELGDGWALDRPLQVNVETYDDHVVARIPELGVFGEGDVELDALDDLRASLVDLAAQLDSLETGSELADRWRRLVRRVEGAAAR